jgi:pimeloyl-ACP methyl ester carboxylesterase
LTGARTDKIYLFGYSGGAQFAHRFALLYPHRIKRLCLGAPGFYSLPDDTIDFPLGIRGMSEAAGQAIDLNAFLSLPLCLIVGAKDIKREASLFQSEEVDRIQGMNRCERAFLWFTKIFSLAYKRGCNTEYLFKTLDGCPHSFELCMTKGLMGDTVADFFK